MIASRINEVLTMCGRENPVYDQISSYSVALYAVGHFEASDLMSVDDLDMGTASEILKANFDPVDESEIPLDYTIMSSPEKYMLVVGDPLFPIHFAAVVDFSSDKPFFSKPGYTGSGFDNMEDMMAEIPYESDLTGPDIHYFKSR